MTRTIAIDITANTIADLDTELARLITALDIPAGAEWRAAWGDITARTDDPELGAGVTITARALILVTEPDDLERRTHQPQRIATPREREALLLLVEVAERLVTLKGSGYLPTEEEAEALGADLEAAARRGRQALTQG